MTRINEAAAKFDGGVLALREYLLNFEEAEVGRAVSSLRAATRLHPGKADYWVALGFALDLDDQPDAALVALRRAIDIDAGDEEAQVLAITLMVEAGQEAQAIAAMEELASRTALDLDAVRRDIADAEMPVDAVSLLANGFIHARNFIRSRLDDAMDRAERASDSDGSGTDSDLEECRRLQVELEQEVDPGGVPAEFRHLVPWILRLGVGDDPCRALVTEALDQGEREQAVEAFSAHAAAINAWLDSFGDESFPPEAAAFLYSLLALEELQAHG